MLVGFDVSIYMFQFVECALLCLLLGRTFVCFVVFVVLPVLLLVLCCRWFVASRWFLIVLYTRVVFLMLSDSPFVVLRCLCLLGCVFVVCFLAVLFHASTRIRIYIDISIVLNNSSNVCNATDT